MCPCHTLVAYFLPHSDPLYKVSIIPRGRALGGTQQLPEKERHTYPEEYLKDRLVVLGGRAAEKGLLGTVSSGADDDIRQATTLARSMVSRWGMSEDIGPVDMRESEEHPFLGREIAQPRRFSEHSAEVVDRAVQTLVAGSGRAGGHAGRPAPPQTGTPDRDVERKRNLATRRHRGLPGSQRVTAARPRAKLIAGAAPESN